MRQVSTLAAAALAAFLACFANAAVAQQERLWRAADNAAQADLQLFREPHYAGGFVRAQTAVPDLGIDWPIRSIRMNSGRWRICEGVNYTGNCAIMNHNIANIDAGAELARIRSIAPVTERVSPRD